MTQTHEAGREHQLIVCPVCGTPNQYGKMFCQDCRSRLQAGRMVGEEEASRLEENRERRARWRPPGRWGCRVLIWLSVASAAGLLSLFLFSPPASPLPPGASMASSDSRPGEWAMYGYDLGHTRSVPGQQPHSGRLKWSINLDTPFATAPVVVGDWVYIATSDGRLVALDAASGKVRWETPLGAPPNGMPAMDGERLYVALPDERLLALDMETGETRWSLSTTGALISSPVVVNGAVYVLSAQGRVISADALTGEKLWEADVAKGWSASAVTWTGDRLLVTTAKEISYFDVLSGENYFTYHLLAGSVLGAPAVLGREAYVAINIGGILALDIDATESFGSQPIRRIWGSLWLRGLAPRPPTPSGLSWVYFVGEPMVAPPAVTEQALYFGTSSGQVVALDLESREPRWIFQAAGAVLGAPAVGGETLYMGAGDHLHAFSTDTGEVQWSFQTRRRISSDVVITADAIYVIDEGANLYAIE